jgi:cation diffusion facilitator CzcD-associated flavoprotein CzcO
VLPKADRLRVFLHGELLTSGFVVSLRMLAMPVLLWRRHLRSQVANPQLRAKCESGYLMGCKRVAFSNDWYPALIRRNVELVTERIVRILPDAVLTGRGTSRAADVLIYGTGFKAAEFLAPLTVSGLDGRTRSVPGCRRRAVHRYGRAAVTAGTPHRPAATPTSGRARRSCTGTGCAALTPRPTAPAS